MTSVLANLLAARSTDGGWAYRDGDPSALEPTALAMLALTVAGSDDLEPGVGWLLDVQRGDGLFDVTLEVAGPNWLTPLAGLALREAGELTAADRTAQTLLTAEALTFSPPRAGIYGYDTHLAGWPFTPGDFSFVEPTALAVLFLKRSGYGQDPRVGEAIALLGDRQLAGGAWNYGEPRVLEADLFPTVGATALAILATADEPSIDLNRAADWLTEQAPTVTTLLSLAWAVLALQSVGRTEPAFDTRLDELWEARSAERVGPAETALYVLSKLDLADHPLRVTS